MKKYFYYLIYLLIFSCTKETNPELINQTFFICFDKEKDPPLNPENINGLPDKCTNIFYFEEFKNDKSGWYRSNDSDKKFISSGGYYQMLNNTMLNYYIRFGLDRDVFGGNFDFTCVVRKVNGTIGEYLSVIWGAKDWRYLEFGIDHVSRYYIKENISQSSGTKMISSGSFSPAVNTNDWYKLTIRRLEGNYFFFANDTLIAKLPSVLHFGSDIGFFVPEGNEFSVDKIEIKTYSF